MKPLDLTTVRRAAPTDATDVARMVGEMAAHDGSTPHLRVSDQKWQSLLAQPEVIVLIAECGGELAGYVSAVRQLHLWTGGDVLTLDDLFVRPEHRDGGVGRRLMTELAVLAAPDALTIRWTVESDNDRAQRFYLRLGAQLRPKTVATWAPAAYA